MLENPDLQENSYVGDLFYCKTVTYRRVESLSDFVGSYLRSFIVLRSYFVFVVVIAGTAV